MERLLGKGLEAPVATGALLLVTDATGASEGTSSIAK